MARSKKRPGKAGRAGAGPPRPIGTGTAPRTERRRVRRPIEQGRADARRPWVRRAFLAAAVAVVVTVAVALEIFIHRLNGEEKTLLARASAAATAAGCGSVEVTGPYPRGLDRFHIGEPPVTSMPAFSTYPSDPPASGPHASSPLAAGVYSAPPPLDRAIHSLEHAAAIVWYDPSATSSGELTTIRTFFARGNESNHVIVAPYDYPNAGTAGTLPSGDQMALAAWHHVRYCERPSLAVAFDFVHSYRFNLYQVGAYRGTAPEKYAPI